MTQDHDPVGGNRISTEADQQTSERPNNFLVVRHLDKHGVRHDRHRILQRHHGVR